MKFTQIFKASLYEPKKLAAFRLLSIGKVFKYVFIFIGILTLLSFIRFLGGNETLFENSPELFEHSEKIGWLIYPIAFLLQAVINTFYIFIRISIFGYVGAILLNIMKRRGDYLQIWRTAAIAMTVPLLITFTLDLFPTPLILTPVLTSIVHVIYLYAAVRYYPISRAKPA